MKVSVVINTYNEEKNIERCLRSVKDFGDEIVLVDMHSSDKTVEIAKKYDAKIFQYEYTRYVEPARNFALSKATGDWILLMDADEELPESLSKKLRTLVENNKVDYVEIPRKNIIFGKWIEHSRWWPDFLVRFFKRGKVKFSDKIHIPPVVAGEGKRLESSEANALVHYNFQSVSQYLERLNRYTGIQAGELEKDGYKFDWQDLIKKPSGEFFSRFFAAGGYKDGLHGLSLALLQGFSELIVYVKVWEKLGFKQQDIKTFDEVARKIIKDYFYWQQKTTTNFIKKILLKLKSVI